MKRSTSRGNSSARQLALGVLAFAFMETWFLSSFWNPYAFGDPTLPSSSLDIAYAVSATGFTLGMALLALLRKTLGPVSSRNGMAASAIALSLSTALAFAAGLGLLSDGAASDASFIAGNALAGFTFAAYCVGAGLFLAAQGTSFLLRCVLVGEAASVALYCAFLLLPTFVFVAGVMVLPLASLACCALLPDMRRHARVPRGESANLSLVSLVKLPIGKAFLGFLACAAAVGFVNEANRTLYDFLVVPTVEASAYLASQVLMAVVVIAFCIVFSVMGAKSSRTQAHAMLLCVATLLLVSTIALPVALLFPEAGPIYVAFAALSKASFELFCVLVWAVCGTMAARDAGNSAALPAGRASWSIGQLLGLVAAAGISTILDAGSAYLYAIVAALAIAAAFVWLFPPRTMAALVLDGDRRSERAIGQVESSFEERCAEVAARFGVSERELDVLVLLAQGRNAAFIQDALSISKSTVSTHRQHIYEKLGIHSQQELIAMVQDAKRSA